MTAQPLSFASSRFRAFTLVELMITVLLLALLTAAVSLSFTVQVREARSHDCIEQLRSFDAAARQLAIRYSRNVKIVFDLSANTLARQGAGKKTSVDCQMSWPSGYRVDEVRTGKDYYANDEAAGVVISAMGLSKTYAVRLRGPDLDQWIIFSGFTGQMVLVPDESTLRSVLSRRDNESGLAR